MSDVLKLDEKISEKENKQNDLMSQNEFLKDEAIKAGNDMIITSDFVAMRDEVLKAVEEGKLEEETINQAVTRIIAWKYSSGLFEK